MTEVLTYRGDRLKWNRDWCYTGYAKVETFVGLPFDGRSLEGWAPAQPRSGGSPTLQRTRIGSERLRRALSGDLAPRAHMTLLAKDAQLAVALAREVDADTALGSAAMARFAAACADGLAGLDDASLYPWLCGR